MRRKGGRSWEEEEFHGGSLRAGGRELAEIGAGGCREGKYEIERNAEPLRPFGQFLGRRSQESRTSGQLKNGRQV